ncbi:MAG: GNAT family N-acetyltransferase [Devosia sp.]|nr:GNAT family N-acetyltransferase [Devosia sp.]
MSSEPTFVEKFVQMINLTIRVARPAEQRALEALQWRASLNNPGDREALQANPDAIELPIDQINSGGVFVAERDGVLAGFAAVLPRPDGQTELDGLFVEPDSWRHGVGRSLVEHCGRFSRAQGATVLNVVGNPHARGFYTACGFVVVGEHQTRFGVGIAMQKPL